MQNSHRWTTTDRERMTAEIMQGAFDTTIEIRDLLAGMGASFEHALTKAIFGDVPAEPDATDAQRLADAVANLVVLTGSHTNEGMGADHDAGERGVSDAVMEMGVL